MAALTPDADDQMDCVLWLEEYFETNGDHQPDSAESHISIAHKKDVYTEYFNEKVRDEQPYVNKDRFAMLWRIVFPKCVKRHACAILGKCDTCAAIACAREAATDVMVKTQLAKAHVLHRGGMFTLERTR